MLKLLRTITVIFTCTVFNVFSCVTAQTSAVQPAENTEDAAVQETNWQWHIPDSTVPVRLIRVHAVAGPTFRHRPNWQESIKKRFEFASEVYEVNFRIRFEVASISEWNEVNELDPLERSFQKLYQVEPTDDTDITAAFLYTGLLRDEQLRNAHADNLGRSAPFGRYLIIRDAPRLATSTKERTLIHELAHMFGALHSQNTESLMARYVEQTDTFIFDQINGERVWQARNYDFRAGIPSLADSVVSRINELYRTNHLDNEDNPLAIAWDNYAADLVIQGKFKEALAAYDKALNIQPCRAVTFLHKGILLKKTGHLEEAAESLQKALDCDGWVAGAAVNLADALLRLKRPKDAIYQLQREVKRRKNNAAAWHLLGVSYAAAGEIDSAIDAYVNAARNDAVTALLPLFLPISKEDINLRLNKLQGDIKNDPENGELQIKEGLLLRLAGKPVEGIINIAHGLESENLPSQAAILYKKAAELDPDNKALRFARADLLLESGKIDEAIRIYSRLVDEDETNIKALRGLADAYKAKGMLATALQYYHRADELEGQ